MIRASVFLAATLYALSITSLQPAVIGSEEQPIVITKPAAERAEERATEQSHSENEQAMTLATVRLWWTTAVLAGATVALVIYTWCANRTLIRDGRINAANQARLMLSAIREQKRTGDAALAAAEAAKRSADASVASLRPWISCKVEADGEGLAFDGRDARIFLKFTLLNIGKTPALDVRLEFPRLILAGMHSAMPIMQDLAKGIRSLPSNVPGILLPGGQPITEATGRSLFPGEDMELRYSLPLKIPDTFETFAPELVGAVSYTYNLSETRGVTAFTYEIRAENGCNLSVGQFLAPAYLQIRRNEMWGGFAT